MKKTILVTGGTGYVGSQTVRHLIDNGHKVVALDNLSTGHRKAVDARAIFEKADLKDKVQLHRIFQKYNFDAVVDFAASIFVGESMKNPEKYIENNVFNFLNLLEVMVENKCLKIVKSSTAAVYGQPNEAEIPVVENYIKHHNFSKSRLLEGKFGGEKTKGDDFFEKAVDLVNKKLPNNIKFSNCQLNYLRVPTSIYGFTKLVDEIILKKFWQNHRLSSISLRYFNACGASFDGENGEDHDPENHLIPNLIKSALNDQPFTLNAKDYPTPDGTCVRDYIHIDDLATAHLVALNHLYDQHGNFAFNLGSGVGYSNHDIIKSVEKIVKKKIQIIVKERRSGDPAILIADSSAAKEKLKWRPKHNLESIISSAYKWHKNNPKGYGE